MNCLTHDDFEDFVDEIQRKQQEKVYISDYHVRSTAKLLQLDPNLVHEAMATFGCKFWPQVLSCRSSCIPNLTVPQDTSELSTVMLQCSQNIAPFLSSTRPEWSRWLNRIHSHSEWKEAATTDATQALIKALTRLLDSADNCCTQARTTLALNGFPNPSLDHLFQIAQKVNPNIPLPILRASAAMCIAAQRNLHPRSDPTENPMKERRQGVIDLGLPDSNEVLGFWGYQDSGFVLQVNRWGEKFVRMKGKRYSLCGKPLMKLIPFIETEMQVKIDPMVESFAFASVSCCTTPCRLEPADVDKLKAEFSRVSLSTIERARHGTGHSQEDVFALRSGASIRIPDAVVWPSSEQDLQALVEVAKSSRWCLIPFGGGTNVTSSTRCPPEDVEPRPIISIDMKLMSRIVWLDEENGLAHVEAGITGRELIEEMKQRGFTIGHEPDSLEFSTLGGWIATKASGMKRSKYGNIEDLVKSVRVVGSDGILRQGFEDDRNVPGRVSEGVSLCSIILGSEGCLGIISSAVIRVWPLPEISEADSILLPNFEQGLSFMQSVGKLGAQKPASVRLLDNEHFRLGQALKPESSLSLTKLLHAAKALFAYWNGDFNSKYMVCATICYEGDREEVSLQKKAMKRLCTQHGGIILGPSYGKAGYDLTFMIAYLRDFAMTYHLLSESFETFCPWSKIATLVQATKERVTKEHRSRHLPGVPFVGCRITQLYHEGACLYFYFCMSFEGVQHPSKVFAEIERAARDEILSNGGSLSHHHGIGKLRASFLKDRCSVAYNKAIKSIKQSVDRDNVFGARNGQFAPEFGTQSHQD